MPACTASAAAHRVAGANGRGETVAGLVALMLAAWATS
jgi:hypothetical protein